jgi:DNA-binding transcriptional MerR regulator
MENGNVHDLLVGDVAKLLGMSPQRVREFDAVLQPSRGTLGVRLYSREAVETFQAWRATHEESDRTAPASAEAFAAWRAEHGGNQ